MLQGTGSDVGKSLLTAGLCRAYGRRGLTVRPFKPQNMSNNAAVTPDGGEIGRAQALQARACGVAPDIRMNPVLLKPQTDVGAQVVVMGAVQGNATARDYHALKPSLLPRVLDAFRDLSAEADLVLVEGAGSAAEVNLREADIANMGFATAAHVPVILVADIDRGGVIASVVGTHALLPEAERQLLKGYVINRFRGDVSLFTPAIDIIKRHTGLDCLGVVPFFEPAGRLPKEDAMALDRAPRKQGGGDIRIAVPRLSRIANFDDLDPLMAEPDVALTIVEPGCALPGDADLVILPGTKATIADLQFLRDQGWNIDIAAHVRRGGKVLGICGGYQMLGRRITDPEGREGDLRAIDGLGLLDVETEMGGDKALVTVSGATPEGVAVLGYEMHLGRTQGSDCTRPLAILDRNRPDGARSANGRVMGGYLHGLFNGDDFRHAFLDALRPGRTSDLAFEASIDSTLDALADHLEEHMDLDRLLHTPVKAT
ncbi:cobyric acid synthase [Magnetospira sp. QH-2]|uniref:cobyric acid synthase n=1 Tax=Magnetospira sp. (strain QH-2) TaxID=1288970 RepID=UPI0005FA5B68|nr:cobyric acid synthase [Magnetospira sp. QH-2]